MYAKCVESPPLYSAPSLYHLSWLERAGLFNRYFIKAATLPHHHGNSRTLLIEAKLCFHSWCSSSAPPSPIPDPEALLQWWQNTPLPDFPLDENGSWSPCDQHIIQAGAQVRASTHAHTHTHCHSAAPIYILKLRHSTSNWQLISTSSYFNKTPRQSE